ncbi:dipeptidyl peptidase 1 [Strongylocentrotus purpuratus]|uniref:Dipeptidyl peptidase 1 n=1 Tax=Strongylocentrotus purpuratus TaxID=7668 RepID=A0A7M7RGK4_STRPU|nr:dipeptidyl peptidase 1 [Strongylocentrotus purpuratus]|eukprot:XP_791043.2 PREDICTED: dipeptidyl peptidase 1 [Strongylocentrotus purpuratus]
MLCTMKANSARIYLWASLVVLLVFLTWEGPRGGTFVGADTPANCSFEEIEGRWKFLMGPSTENSRVNCSMPWKPVKTWIVSLRFPDLAIDETVGRTGFWTLIYNQGYEAVIRNRKFFGFSDFEKISKKKVISYCNVTIGWSHNDDGGDWACFRGEQIMRFRDTGTSPVKVNNLDESATQFDENAIHRRNDKFIEGINKHQDSWKATYYDRYVNLTLGDMRRRAGGKLWKRVWPDVSPTDERTKQAASNLPEKFDWRDVGGIDYVSPVRDQGICGSCYAFASTATQESRLRVMTNNNVKVVMSPQEVVSCSEYAQGCEGGFPYLIAGKYGQDFGLVDETCYPYRERDAPCRQVSCRRFRTSEYHYIGGFYGACNEDLMRLELLRSGPLAISFEVYDDFLFYRGGIYHHVPMYDRFNPWETTNHVVTIVGYGHKGNNPKKGEKYWIVQNTWGSEWGERGYFRIRRGDNECNIETLAVATTPLTN